MSNDYFKFKQFTIEQPHAAMKVGTDGVLIGAWCDVSDSDEPILDVGTGTGLIALMLAQRTKTASIIAIDSSAEAVCDAQRNISASPWSDRTVVLETSVQQYTQDFSQSGRYGLIVSNPPYFVDSLQAPEALRNTARHATELTHDTLLGTSAQLLRQSGRLSIILPVAEAEAVERKAVRFGFTLTKVCSVYSTPRSGEIRRMMTFVKERLCITPLHNELYIHSGDEYSDEYRRLTGEFYLKF